MSIVYLEFELDGEPLGQIQANLFQDLAPLACGNFLKLCIGGSGFCKETGKPLCYKSSLVHKVIPNYLMQFGDFIYNNGSGGMSIYGKEFSDENLSYSHNRRGLLAMANKGPNTNSSQVIITFREVPSLKNKYTIFGEIIKGFSVLNKIEVINTNAEDYPLQKLVISKCGVVERKSRSQSRSSYSSSSSSSYNSSRSRSRSRSNSISERIGS
jgi:cyclophilin family peptidyl-prolyl cis-trans isomerase